MTSKIVLIHECNNSGSNIKNNSRINRRQYYEQEQRGHNSRIEMNLYDTQNRKSTDKAREIVYRVQKEPPKQYQPQLEVPQKKYHHHVSDSSSTTSNTTQRKQEEEQEEEIIEESTTKQRKSRKSQGLFERFRRSSSKNEEKTEQSNLTSSASIYRSSDTIPKKQQELQQQDAPQISQSKNRHVKVHFTDMPGQMEHEAINKTVEGLKRGLEKKELAAYVKDHFDRQYKPCWQVVLGSQFSSQITYQEGTYISFTIDELAVLIFKA